MLKIGMATRVYLSNLSPRLWPEHKQREALADVLPGAKVFRDMLTGANRQGRRADRLANRDTLLRATTRPNPTEITAVAALPVLDWTTDGLLKAIKRLLARGGELHVMVPPMVLRPNAGVSELSAATEAFASAKKREQAKDRGERGGLVGGKASAEKRRAAAAARIDAAMIDGMPVRYLWRHGDQRHYRSADLLDAAGVSRNTMIEHCKTDQDDGKRKGPR